MRRLADVRRRWPSGILSFSAIVHEGASIRWHTPTRRTSLEVLDRLAGVMRERFRIKREVRVKSAHGRITAFVLAGMPPVLALFLLAENPDAVRLLINDPLGVRMLLAAGVLQIVGTLIVRKLADIQY